jgi:glyoxylase-like metal-dependent hydrolase (beta-lactamase superfamily II)
MLEVQKNIYVVFGEDKARFPHCNGLYLKGNDLRVLVDAGMGNRAIGACLEQGIDILILSHCHYDHRSTIRLMPDIPIWCHEVEAPYLEDSNSYYEGMGITRSDIDLEELQRSRPFRQIHISRGLRDGEVIDLGGLTLEIIHTPGHTPGHLAFNVASGVMLFTADVSLTNFGPFYGNDFADIEDFKTSIRKLKDLRPKQVLTGHLGPLRDNITERFDSYEAVFMRKEQKLLAAVNKSCRMDDLVGRNLFFPFYYEPLNLLRWFERLEIEKHLHRLEQKGRIRKEGEFIIKDESQ